MVGLTCLRLGRLMAAVGRDKEDTSLEPRSQESTDGRPRKFYGGGVSKFDVFTQSMFGYSRHDATRYILKVVGCMCILN